LTISAPSCAPLPEYRDFAALTEDIAIDDTEMTRKGDNRTSRVCITFVSRWLIGCFAVVCSIVANAQVNSNELPPPRLLAMDTNDTQAMHVSGRECATRIAAFVKELDSLLASDPSTIYPVFDLLNRYFPVEGCDIQDAIGIARESRFFSLVSEEKTYYVIVFDSKGVAGWANPGFYVQFSLIKTSGNSRLPAAHVNQ
jgi:hypothetical protein